MVYNNFSRYDIDLEKKTVFSKSPNKNKFLKLTKDKKGYTRVGMIDDFGNHYHFWHEVLYCIANNITRDKIPYDENGDRYEIDHIKPVREGGSDEISNLRLGTHKDNMNNPNTLKYFSEIKKGISLSEEHKRNISEGNKGKIISEEAKKKMSESKNGNKNWLGKHHSEDTKKKISEKLSGNKNWLGKHHSEDTKKKLSKINSKPVKQYTLDGELVAIWPSAAEAGKNGYNKEAINHCCVGINKTHKGFIWKR